MARGTRLTPQELEGIAAAAADRYRRGETWSQIAADYGLSSGYLRRLTVSRHNITYHRWGNKPVADPDDVAQRRAKGLTLDQIADELSCSRQAVRTALERAGETRPTRYPRLSGRRKPTAVEVEHLSLLYRACPPAPRARPGARNVRDDEGRTLAEECRALVDAGVPMATLSQALGRGPTWVHWLLSCHNLRQDQRAPATTARRTRL